MRFNAFRKFFASVGFALALTASAAADIYFDLNASSWKLLGGAGTPYADKSILSYLFYYVQDSGYRLSFSSRTPPSFAGVVALTVPGRSLTDVINFGATSISGENAILALQFTIVVSDPASISCYYILNGAAVSFPALHSGENILAVPGISVTGYQSIACSNISSDDVDLLVTQLAAISPVSPSPTPSPSPSPSPTPIPIEYALEVTFTDSPAPVVNGNVSVVKILPSINGCGALKPEFYQRNFRVQCIEKASGTVIAGCRLGSALELGTDHGGHEHDFDTRPLGDVSPADSMDQLVDIPIAGLQMSYESPEVAGDVNLTLSGFDPNGRSVDGAGVQFQVTRGEFEALRAPGFQISVDSHPDGDRGTTRMQEKLSDLLRRFNEKAQKIFVSQSLISEGASLPRGGLFDYNFQVTPWEPPHCGHRDGETLDLSYSIFDDYDPALRLYLIVSLEKALIAANFRFNLEDAGQSGKHYHIHLK